MRLSDLRLILVGLHLLFGAAQVLLLFPFSGCRRRDRLNAIWSGQMLRLLGIRLETEVHEADIRHGLLVCNHISFVDIFLINALMPSRFVAKQDIAHWPLIGWLCRHGETIFIERGSRQAVQRTREHMQQALAQGKRVVVFPEGTTTAGDQVLPFHGALLQSAIDANAELHVLTISYHGGDGSRSEAPAYYGDVSMLACLRSMLAAREIRARIGLATTCLPPHADRRHLAHRAHQAITAHLRKRV